MPQPDDLRAVIRIPGIGQGPPAGGDAKTDRCFRMSHGEGLQGKIREREQMIQGFMKRAVITPGFDPAAKHVVQPFMEVLETRWTDHLEGEASRKVDGIVCGKKKGDQVGNMIGMKMAQTDKIDPAEVDPRTGHLPERSGAWVEENKMFSDFQDEAGRATLHRRGAGAGTKDMKGHHSICCHRGHREHRVKKNVKYKMKLFYSESCLHPLAPRAQGLGVYKLTINHKEGSAPEGEYNTARYFLVANESVRSVRSQGHTGKVHKCALSKNIQHQPERSRNEA